MGVHGFTLPADHPLSIELRDFLKRRAEGSNETLSDVYAFEYEVDVSDLVEEATEE